MSENLLDQCINDRCPWSGDPVSPDSLTRYRGRVVGFCNQGYRDKFDLAIQMFEEASSSSDVVSGREEREFETLEDWAVGKERFSVYDISTACCAQCRRRGRRARPLHFAPW